MKNRSSNNQTNNICLMLYNEVLTYMDEYDLELRYYFVFHIFYLLIYLFSGISIDDSFTLPDLILAHIHSSIE